MDINQHNIAITKLQLSPDRQIDVLRLDTIHPTVSGNKWYKLKYNLQEAVAQNAKCIITHGGPFSNHLHATAFACNALKIPCIGLVNGKNTNNQTLQDCEAWGMDLEFIGYSNKEKTIQDFLAQLQDAYFIEMGGDNALGQKGAAEILNGVDANYTHIICSVGTGTTLAGIIESAAPHQTVIGISAIADDKVENKLKVLFPGNKKWQLINDYTFGGFAKINDALEDYIYNFFDQHNMALDVVYTAKLFYGLEDLMAKNYFDDHAKILCIHTGGLQGNAGFAIDVYNQ
jgi:1-aminocyclopropane-1-carboxylate deaminase